MAKVTKFSLKNDWTKRHTNSTTTLFHSSTLLTYIPTVFLNTTQSTLTFTPSEMYQWFKFTLHSSVHKGVPGRKPKPESHLTRKLAENCSGSQRYFRVLQKTVF